MKRCTFTFLVAVAAGPQATKADASFLQPVQNFFSELFGDYGDLGPTLVPYNVTVRNTKFIYTTINRDEASKTLVWPSEDIKKQAGIDAWGEWRPKPGMTASVLFGWGSGQKWLLHIPEADKYMVVRDPVISNSWKQGKKFWFDHHVKKGDPRHTDRIQQEEKEQKEAAAEKSKKPAAEGKCNGLTTGKGQLPPTWVIVVMCMLFCGIVGLGVKTFFLTQSTQKARKALEQAAGESSAEQKKQLSTSGKTGKEE
jgi:hypothetical protein